MQKTSITMCKYVFIFQNIVLSSNANFVQPNWSMVQANKKENNGALTMESWKETLFIACIINLNRLNRLLQ